jgi:LacI family transcriptional regulator
VSTIKDIARLARVSTATVSYVLNGTRPVSSERHQRVMAAIAELQYRPNAVAQSLRRKRTRTIGLVIPDNSNPFFAEVAKGVEDAGYEAGVSVILCNSDSSFDRELRYMELLQDKRVDGLIFIATTTKTDHVRGLTAAGVPLVTFYRQLPDVDVDTLVVDNLGGGYQATQHLIELGHTAIACVAPASTESPSSLRVKGFRQAMAEAGLPVDEALIYHGDNRFSGGRDGAEHLLQTGKPITAIFAGNDVMAIGVMRTLQLNGLRVPDDISVVGFDGISLGAYVTPALTSVVQPRYEAGQLAFKLLQERMRDGYIGSQRAITLETRLEVRDSTAPPAGGARTNSPRV